MARASPARFSSWSEYLSYGGNSNISGVPSYTSMPSGVSSQGSCPADLPAGFFIVNSSSYYYSNGQGPACSYSSLSALEAAAGSSNVPQMATLPTVLTNTAACSPSASPTPTSSQTLVNYGQTGTLAKTDSGNANLVSVQQTNFSQGGTLHSLSFYVDTAAGNLVLGVYDSSGANGGPGKLVAQTQAFTPVVGWNTYSLSSTASVSAGSYWLAYLPSSNNLVMGFVSASGQQAQTMNYTYSSTMTPSTFGPASDTGTGNWSIYATVAVSSSSTAAPSPSPTATATATPTPTPTPTATATSTGA